MKPMSERTYVEQALKNGKGITWLGDARIPPPSPQDARMTEQKNRHANFGSGARENRVYGADLKPRSEQGNYDATKGRFPANLLASNSVLDSENTAFSRFFDLASTNPPGSLLGDMSGSSLPTRLVHGGR
jgi:hypothetical protein